MRESQAGVWYTKPEKSGWWPAGPAAGQRVATAGAAGRIGRTARHVACCASVGVSVGVSADDSPLHGALHPGAGRAINIGRHCARRARLPHYSMACAEYACRGDSICRRSFEPRGPLERKCFARTLRHPECPVDTQPARHTGAPHTIAWPARGPRFHGVNAEAPAAFRPQPLRDGFQSSGAGSPPLCPLEQGAPPGVLKAVDVAC